MRPGLLALLEHRNRDLPQPRRQLGALLQQLSEPDRAGKPRRARADHKDADVDPFVRRSGRGGHELRRVERRRIVGRLQLLRARTSSVSLGTISCRSPTTPKSQNSKMGALGSLLIATITPEPCMPTLCWIAPEMPQAM